MELYSQLQQALCFEKKSSQNVQKERKILKYYSGSEFQRNKKSKADFFCNESMVGLGSILNINYKSLDLINGEDLVSQFCIFMQGATKIILKKGDCFSVKPKSFMIFLEGTIRIKKNQTIQNDPISRWNKTMKRNDFRLNNGEGVKNFNKTIKTNKKQSPILLNSQNNEQNNFQCLQQFLCLQFSQASLCKLEKWIQIQEHSNLSKFIFNCLPQIDLKKTLYKLALNARVISLQSNVQWLVEPNQIIFLFKGTALLSAKEYRAQINKHSIVYREKEDKNEFKISCTSPKTIIISINNNDFKEAMIGYEQIFNAIRNRLLNLHNDKKIHFQVESYDIQEQSLLEPIFSTDILKVKNFFSSNPQQKKQFKQIEGIKANRNNLSRGTTSKRFRITQHTQQHSLNINQQNSIFLSNYPFVKLVQSQEIAHSILQSSAPKIYERKSRNKQHELPEDEKKRIQKEIKKLYYNDKTLKLKIKSIVEKEIPNGKKRNFDNAKIQKQIQEISLFRNVIQYPTEGQNKLCIFKEFNSVHRDSILNKSRFLFQKKRKSLSKSKLKQNENSQFETIKTSEFKPMEDLKQRISIYDESIDIKDILNKPKKVISIESVERQEKSTTLFYNKQLNSRVVIKRGKKACIIKSSFKKQKQNTPIRSFKIQTGGFQRNLISNDQLATQKLYVRNTKLFERIKTMF